MLWRNIEKCPFASIQFSGKLKVSPVEENQKTLCPYLAISIQAPVWQPNPERQTIELVTAAFAFFATISAIYWFAINSIKLIYSGETTFQFLLGWAEPSH